MDARIASLYRHPVKGFTPERLTSAMLEAGACFPCDRLYAVEDGPSGFDPAAPDPLLDSWDEPDPSEPEEEASTRLAELFVHLL